MTLIAGPRPRISFEHVNMGETAPVINPTFIQAYKWPLIIGAALVAAFVVFKKGGLGSIMKRQNMVFVPPPKPIKLQTQTDKEREKNYRRDF